MKPRLQLGTSIDSSYRYPLRVSSSSVWSRVWDRKTLAMPGSAVSKDWHFWVCWKMWSSLIDCPNLIVVGNPDLKIKWNQCTKKRHSSSVTFRWQWCIQLHFIQQSGFRRLKKTFLVEIIRPLQKIFNSENDGAIDRVESSCSMRQTQARRRLIE